MYTICITLSLSLYENKYKRYCSCLDDSCKACCYHFAQNYRSGVVSARWSTLSEQASTPSSSDEIENDEEQALVDL